MNRILDLANAGHRKSEDPDAGAPRRHCIILTLIGLAAIGVSIVLPPDENAPAAKASRKERALQQVAMPAAASEPTADPAENVSAPLEVPAGDIATVSPTF